MNLYMVTGLHGPIADYAMKKYKGHRCIPYTVTANVIKTEYDQYISSKYPTKNISGTCT